MKDNYYIVIQGWMVSRLKLTGNALMVYACIFGFSQNGEWFTGTAGYLADWCDCQKKYMLKLLKKMTDEGLLRKRTREQNGVAFCDYQPITPEERCEQQQKDASGGTSQSAPPVHKVDPPGAQSAPHNIKDNIDSRESKDSLVCANNGGFDAFWAAYPKKKSKGQALSAWKKLKPDSSLQVVILKANDAQKHSHEWLKDKGQYIPYPET